MISVQSKIVMFTSWLFTRFFAMLQLSHSCLQAWSWRFDSKIFGFRKLEISIMTKYVLWPPKIVLIYLQIALKLLINFLHWLLYKKTLLQYFYFWVLQSSLISSTLLWLRNVKDTCCALCGEIMKNIKISQDIERTIIWPPYRDHTLIYLYMSRKVWPLTVAAGL